MPDSTIDLTDPDAPEILDWSGAVRGHFHRLAKRQVTLRIDADVQDWFERHAPRGEYQTNNINNALREYVADRERAGAGK